MENVAEPLLDWLLGPIELDLSLIPSSIKDINIGAIVEFILDLLGLSFDKVVDAAVNGLMSVVPGALVNFLEDFLPLIRDGDWPGLYRKIQEKAEENPVLTFFTQAASQIAVPVGLRVAAWIASVVPGPGWVAGVLNVISGVYNLFVFIQENWQRFRDVFGQLLERARDIFNTATGDNFSISEGWINQQAGLVRQILNTATFVVAGGLSSLVGFQPILRTVHRVYNSVVGVVPRTVESMARRVAESILARFQRKGLHRDQPLVPEVSLGANSDLYARMTDSGRSAEIWVKTGNSKRELREEDVAEAGHTRYRQALAKARALVAALREAGGVRPGQALRPGQGRA